MNCNHFTRLTGSKRNLLALLASSAVFTAGCANMATTAPTSNPLSVGATIGGRVHGGNQPVGGAVVNLYYAGEHGMGSGDPNAGVGLGAPILAATTTTANDGTGSFSFVKDPNNGDTTTERVQPRARIPPLLAVPQTPPARLSISTVWSQESMWPREKKPDVPMPPLPYMPAVAHMAVPRRVMFSPDMASGSQNRRSTSSLPRSVGLSDFEDYI